MSSSDDGAGEYDPEKQRQEKEKKKAEGAKKVKEVTDALGLPGVPEGGLSTGDADAAHIRFGYNEIPKKKESKLLKFLGFWGIGTINPLIWAMEVAAFIAIGLVDYIDFILIFFLLLANATLGYYEEVSAGDAIAALEKTLAPACKCYRDGKLVMGLPARELVPGDVIQIRLGDTIPADCVLLEGDGLKIDQAALTGESMPVNRKHGETGLSGSNVVQGEQTALVTAVGKETFLGNAVALVQDSGPSGHFQLVLRSVGFFCIFFIIIWVFIELVVQFAGRRVPCSGVTEFGNCQVLQNILVLIVGGIPIAMPIVLSVTMSIGAKMLGKKDAIVKRLTAVEEMAGMTILCSDKTGTLTLNKLSVHTSEPYVKSCSPAEVLFQAALAASAKNQDAIDTAILNYLRDHESMRDLKSRYDPMDSENNGDFQQLKYYPFDPVSKVTRSKILSKRDKVIFFTMKGAPQVVLARAKNKDEIKNAVEAKIESLAKDGFRCIGVARSDARGKEWEMTGLIPLFDPPRPDTKVTIERIKHLHLDVKMITGDQTSIAKTTCRELGMREDVLNAEKIRDPKVKGHGHGKADDEPTEKRDHNWMTTDKDGNPCTVGTLCLAQGGFAQVYPEDKYNIVRWLQEEGNVVGMTGDGVNDAPALAQANIGIAVDDATDAARGASDIVLSSPGLSVIVDAIIGARKIFQRMKNYCMYSIHNCMRLCLVFGILTVAFDWYFPTIGIVLLAICNDGCMLSVSTDQVQPSDKPDNWNLNEIFGIAALLGLWNASSTIALFLVVQLTDAFTSSSLHLSKLDKGSLNGLIYAQVSISSMATIFVTRSRGFAWRDRPGAILFFAFWLSQIAASFLASYGLTGQYPLNGVAMFGGCGWGWVLVAWLWSLVFFFPMDLLKFCYRGALDRKFPSWGVIWNTEARFHDPRKQGPGPIEIRKSFEEPKGPGGPTSIS